MGARSGKREKTKKNKARETETEKQIETQRTEDHAKQR